MDQTPKIRTKCNPGLKINHEPFLGFILGLFSESSFLFVKYTQIWVRKYCTKGGFILNWQIVLQRLS